jgi:hypothetical protein
MKRMRRPRPFTKQYGQRAACNMRRRRECERLADTQPIQQSGEMRSALVYSSSAARLSCSPTAALLRSESNLNHHGP